MTKYEMLDRILSGEQVEATEDVVALAGLADEVEAVFTAAEPSLRASRGGMSEALGAFRESAPSPVVPTRTRRMAARMLVAAAMVVAVPSVGWAASENAMPGDLLYPIKRAFEQIRLVIATSPADEAKIELDIAAERLGEAARARALGLDDAVQTAVEGYATAMAGFEQSIVQARAEGADVTALVAVATGLAENHQALLDALLSQGPPAGTNPVVTVTPGHAADPQGEHGKANAKGKAKGHAKDKAGSEAEGKAKGQGGGKADHEPKGQANDGKPAKGEKENDGGSGGATNAPEPPDRPGRAEDAPQGKAEGHQKHGSPPHGPAKGLIDQADPPPIGP